MKSRAHDADDGERLFVEDERLSNRGRIAGVPAEPQTMADRDDGESFFIRARESPDYWVSTQNGIECRRSEDRAGEVDALRSGKLKAIEGVPTDTGETRRLRLPIRQIGIRHRQPSRGRCRRDGPHRVEAIWIGVGQRLEHDGVDDAEDGRVRADPERERHDDCRAEGGVAAQYARRVSNVL